MDLREEPTGDLHMLPYLMQRLIIIANATGVEPVGAWWRATSRGLVANYDDTLQAALTGRQAGFRGALCMRANQVEALNKGFTPSESEVESYTEISSSVIAWANACAARDQARELVIGQSRSGPD